MIVTVEDADSQVVRKLGLWLEDAMPKTGWSEEFVSDFGDNHPLCEMCMCTHIRFGHHLTHTEFEGELVVGCVCAGHLTGDHERAKQQERQAKRAASATQRVLVAESDVDWFSSQAGNPCFQAGPWRGTVFPDRKRLQHWKWVLSKGNEKPSFSKRSFDDVSAAKQACEKQFLEKRSS